MGRLIDVRITGFKELNRALKRVEPELQKGLRNELRTVAGDIAGKVRAKMPTRSGRAVRSVKSGATMRSAYVQHGNASAPYVGWLDFGGTLRPTGGRKNTITRPIVPGGRYLYPTIAENRESTLRAALNAFQKAARRANLLKG